jgi:antibiotic biosynthesis monooxygenase (ABM) superfamily enzyme
MLRKSTLVVFAGLVTWGLPAWSQDYPLRAVTRNVVKADRIAEYEDLSKQLVAMMQKAGADRWSVVFRTAVGNPREYWVVSPLAKYADRDQPPAWFSKVPQGQGQALFNRLQACVETSHTTIDRARDDLSIVTPGNPIAPFARVIRTRVRAGKAVDYANLVKSELLPAYKTAGVKSTRVRQVQFGGSRNEFVSSTGFEKWAELDEPSPLVKALGQDGANKYLEKVSQLVAGSDYLILRYRLELSRPPQTAATTTSSR